MTSTPELTSSGLTCGFSIINLIGQSVLSHTRNFKRSPRDYFSFSSFFKIMFNNVKHSFCLYVYGLKLLCVGPESIRRGMWHAFASPRHACLQYILCLNIARLRRIRYKAAVIKPFIMAKER